MAGSGWQELFSYVNQLSWSLYFACFAQFCADAGQNPDSGVSSYDNFLIAMLNNFVAITGEGWSLEMYNILLICEWCSLLYYAHVIVSGTT